MTLGLTRRELVVGVGALALAGRARAAPPDPLTMGARELAAAVRDKKVSCVEVVQAVLARIDAVDVNGPALRSVLEVNPDALAIARRLDEALAHIRSMPALGPLHGVPVVVKDNIDTADRMSTCAGSLALVGVKRASDSDVVAKLRAAGAIVVGKANLSEWANFRSNFATSGWSARGGFTKNPHVLDRNTSGSSSGSAVAVAAGIVPLAVGTETDGSILSPASMCGVVGHKPALGLVSQRGIIPISSHQDTAGPMARTVADAALLLDVIRATPGARTDVSGSLKGVRIGVARSLAGFHPDVDACFESALVALKGAGAVVVDPQPMPSTSWFRDEGIALEYEFKVEIAAYLAALPSSPVRTLADLIAFDDAHPDELKVFGHDLFVSANGRGPLTSKEYVDARANVNKLAREALDAGLKGVDVYVAPSNAPAWMTDAVDGDHWLGGSSSVAAVTGAPSVTVPMGFTHALPLGLSFVGPIGADAKVLKIAAAFERATNARRAPAFLARAP